MNRNTSGENLERRLIYMTNEQISLKTYMQLVENVAFYPQVNAHNMAAATYLVLGLCGEAGEVSEKFKKIIRDEQLDPTVKLSALSVEQQEEILNEMGDVVWYVARIAVEIGKDINEVLQVNYDKLMSRYHRGMIGGSGDNR